MQLTNKRQEVKTLAEGMADLILTLVNWSQPLTALRWGQHILRRSLPPLKHLVDTSYALIFSLKSILWSFCSVAHEGIHFYGKATCHPWLSGHSTVTCAFAIHHPRKIINFSFPVVIISELYSCMLWIKRREPVTKCPSLCYNKQQKEENRIYRKLM